MRKDSPKSNRYDIELSLLKQADGSCRFSDIQYRSIVLCGIYGPDESSTRSKEHIDKAFIDVSIIPASGITNPVHRSWELGIANTFRDIIAVGMFPRRKICIIIQILQKSDNVLAACYNACSLALMDAGIPMKMAAIASSDTITTSNSGKKISSCIFVFNMSLADDMCADGALTENEIAEKAQCSFELNRLYDSVSIMKYFQEARLNVFKEARLLWKDCIKAVSKRSDAIRDFQKQDL